MQPSLLFNYSDSIFFFEEEFLGRYYTNTKIQAYNLLFTEQALFYIIYTHIIEPFQHPFTRDVILPF